MAGGFSVAIGSDTRLFEQGVKTGVISPVEDAQDALQDLAKSADKAGSSRGLDKLGRAGKDAADDIQDGAKKADRALGDLGDSGRDAAEDVEAGAKQADKALDQLGRSGKEAGDDLEDSLRDAQRQTGKTAAEYREMAEKVRAETAKIKAQSRDDFEGAGGATGEFRDEALSNFSEVTSSFTGDMQSITDLAQGTFGGLASLGGPASLVFGGLAVAVGLVGQAFATSGEESDEFKEKIADLAQTRLGDLFGQYEDSGDDLAKGLRSWATDADSFGGSLLDLQKNARKADLGVGELTAAIGQQSIPKMKQLRGVVEDQIETLQRQAAALSDGTAQGRIASKGAQEQADAAREVKKQLDSNLAVNDSYEKSLRAVAMAQGMTVDEYKASLDASAAYQAATESLADTMKTTLADAAESTSEALDNAAGDPQAYIDGLNQRTAAAQQYQANVQAIGEQLPSDLFNFVRNQGPGFSQEIATYLSASPEQQAQIAAGWKIDAQVTADTSDVDQKTAEKGKEKKAGPTSELKGDTKDVDKKVADQASKKSDGPTVKVRADDSAVDSKLAALRDRVVNGPTVKIRYDSDALDAYLARPRTITVNVRQGQEVK